MITNRLPVLSTMLHPPISMLLLLLLLKLKNAQILRGTFGHGLVWRKGTDRSSQMANRRQPVKRSNQQLSASFSSAR